MSGAGIRSAFDIGRKSLQAQLAGLNITGNNIANVNTEGYSRQKLQLSPSLPIKLPDGTFGTGVDIDGIQRVRDQLVDRQLRNELELKGYYQSLEQIYSEIETIMNEPSETGLRSQISEFFDNFYELANDPENSTIRFNLRSQAETMSLAFNRIDEQIRILSQDIDFEIRSTIDRFNALTNEVAELNNQIITYEGVSKGAASDLRDQRDRALDEMSEMMEIYIFENPNGSVNVAAQSQTIVTSNYPVQFDIQTRNENGNLVSDIISQVDGSVFQANNGKLGALIEARNTLIPYYRDRLNDLAKEIIDNVNTIHQNGVGLKGTSTEIPKDNSFFQGTDASTIALDFAIQYDLNNIAAAERVDTELESGVIVTSGSPGDNTIALEIADLKQKLILNNGTESLIDFFNAIVSEIGNETKRVSDSVNNQNLMIEQFTNLRDSVSGVSLDEEYVNLIKYQRGYEASAKLITTVDEMFETLINMV